MLGRQPGRHPHFGQGAVDQIAQAHQGAVEHAAGSAGQADIAFLDDRQRKRGGAQQVAQFMREESQPHVQCVGLLLGDDEIVLVAEFGDGGGDGIVQAAVEGPEFIDVDQRVAFECQIGDGLAKVAVVVDDFLDRKTMLQQFFAVECCRFADLRQRRLAAARGSRNLAAVRPFRRLFHLQRLDQLIEKDRHPVFQLFLRHAWRRPLRDFHSASGNQLFAVRSEEFVHHPGTIR